MFRDRTNLFITYRRTYPHHNQLEHETLHSGSIGFGRDEEVGLMNDDDETLGGLDDAIPLRELPPNFIELSQEIEEVLKFIDSKINELNYLYKKNLLPGFNDNSLEIKKIDDMNFTITKNFQKTYNMIKRIDNLQRQSHLNQDELMMCENMKKKLALDTQLLSQRFRKLQNNYIKFLKDDEDYEVNYLKNSSSLLDEDEGVMTNDIESYSRQLLLQSQLLLEEEQSGQNLNSSMLKQREEEISKIATGVIEISTMFRELENLVIDQGTILDRIDYNLDNVTYELKLLDKELIKSSKTQKRTQKCKLIFLLSLIVFALFLIVLIRPRHVVHDQNGTPQQPQSAPETPLNDRGSILQDEGDTGSRPVIPDLEAVNDQLF